MKNTRSTEIDVEKCVKNAGGNKFDLIIQASQRTRELKAQAKESGKFVSVVDALLEVQNKE